MNKTPMWTQPWTFREGLFIGLGLVVTGLLLQLTTGGVRWVLFAFPVNAVALIVYLCFLVLLFLLRQKSYPIRFLLTAKAAASAFFYVVVLTILMGVTRQTTGDVPHVDPLGLTQMLSSWPFVLAYLWLTTIVGLAALQQVATFKGGKLPSLLCHLGLFVVLLCGTLGAADVQELKMYCVKDTPEWRAVDAQGHVVELPIAIQLNQFILEEYPAELQKVRVDSGKTELMKMSTPKRYASKVDIYTQEGESLQTTIEVNKPATIAGWKIYQYSYDGSMGNNYHVSIFQLVKEPWLPVVYVGIGVLLVGAVLMLFRFEKQLGNRQKGEDWL